MYCITKRATNSSASIQRARSVRAFAFEMQFIFGGEIEFAETGQHIESTILQHHEIVRARFRSKHRRQYDHRLPSIIYLGILAQPGGQLGVASGQHAVGKGVA